MGLSIVTYALCKKYVDDTLQGGGALKGKNCTIDDISAITGGNRVTFKWTLDDGTVQTGYMDVMDGADGQDGVDGQDGQDGAPGQQGPQGPTGPAGNGINTMEIRSINGVSHLILTYTNAPSVEVDCGIIESNGEGKVYHDDDDWTPITLDINGLKHSSFVPNNNKRTIIVDKIAIPMNSLSESYLKVLTSIASSNPKANYNITLESGHKYFLQSDHTYEGYLQEIVEGDGESHDYSEKKPVIIDLTESFGAGYEPNLENFVAALGGNSGIYNKFSNVTVIGWWNSYFGSNALSSYNIKGLKQNGTLVDIEDFSTVDPYLYTNYPGYEDANNVKYFTTYDYAAKQTTYKTNSQLCFTMTVLTKLTSAGVAAEFVYTEDGSKHYLIKKTGYRISDWGGSDFNARYNPSLNPSDKLNMRLFFGPNLNFDGISVNDFLNAESRTSENNLNSFAGVSTAQFDNLDLNSDYFYPAWRYDDCNSIKDFFLKWGYDLDALDTLDETSLVPYLHVSTTGIALKETDWTPGTMSQSIIMPKQFTLEIDEDIVDLFLAIKLDKGIGSSNYNLMCLQFIGRELLSGCKESSEDLIDKLPQYVTRKNPKASGTFILGSGTVSSDNGVSLFDGTVDGVRAFAAGYNSKALGANSFTFGDSSETDMSYAVAIGQGSKATKEGAISIGRRHMWVDNGQIYTNEQLADGYGSIAMGTGTQATADFSIALGKDAAASGENSCSIGYNTLASGQYSFARGSYSQATAKNATAIGEQCRALTPNSIAIGNNCKAGELGGDTAIALGVGCQAKKYFAIAIGNTSLAGIDNCIAIGNQARSSDVGTIAIGCSAQSNSGQHGICIGDNSTSNNGENIALGYKASALAPDSIAIGTQATASRHGGIAIGHNASIGSTQWYSIAIGGGSKVTAGGRGIAIGEENCEVKGDCAVAIGVGTIARANQVVIGPLNIEDTEDKYAFIVGNGTMNNVAPHNRSNLLAVTKTGVIEATNLPAAPTTQGSYVLTCIVDANGDATYSWESTT